MITQERVDMLSEILSFDQGRATRLIGLDANTALEEINALGYDFTLEEIKAYGAIIRDKQKSFETDEELSLDVLDDVAGGGEANLFFVKVKW